MRFPAGGQGVSLRVASERLGCDVAALIAIEKPLLERVLARTARETESPRCEAAATIAA